MQQFLAAVIAAGIVFLALQQMKPKSSVMVPKLLINNANHKTAPFIDATGAHAGALLGDVRHDLTSPEDWEPLPMKGWKQV